MENKNLPLKIFFTREKDQLDTEGGGGNPPKWVLKGSQLKKRAEGLKVELKNVKLDQKTKKRKYIPSILTVNLKDKAIAKSYRPKIESIFNENYENNVVAVTNDFNLLVKIDGQSKINKLNDNLTDYKKYDYSISGIDKINEFRPVLDYPKTINTPIKIKLINFGDDELNSKVRIDFEELLKSQKGIIHKKTMYTDELVVYKISNPDIIDKREIEEFEGLFSIEPMPKFEVTLDEFKHDKKISIKAPEKEINYTIVGVLDSGIKDIPQIKPWLLKENHLSHPESHLDKRHGTFVAGILEYNNELLNLGHDLLSGFHLFDAAVFPAKKGSIDEDELLGYIQDAVSLNAKKVKLWNMSLGTRTEADLNNFSDFGYGLDKLQDDYGVLIIKSAGNCDNFTRGKPKSRISESADSVRSLVVGSIAHSKDHYDLSEKDHPSPFSRKGRAPGHIIKPDVSDYGGNAGIDTNGVPTINGVPSFDLNGNVVNNIGTSFSTPRVTALTANIMNNLNEDFNPLLLKGLTIHSAKYPSSIRMPLEEKIENMGFGVPANLKDILYNDVNEITLILQDKLRKGYFLDVFEFPFPQEMVEKNLYYGEITITLVNSPLIDIFQGPEYCQSDIEVLFGTYDKLKARDTNIKTIKNPIGRDNSNNILKESYYNNKKKDLNYAYENLLINFGKKYHPVKKYKIDLAKILPSKTKFIEKPKKWFLKLNGLYRNSVLQNSIKKGFPLEQEFCLIITVKDPKRKHKIYDIVSNNLTQNNFIHRNINLKTQVRVSV